MASIIDSAADRANQVAEEIETVDEANVTQSHLVSDIATAIEELEATVAQIDTTGTEDSVVIERDDTQ